MQPGGLCALLVQSKSSIGTALLPKIIDQETDRRA